MKKLKKLVILNKGQKDHLNLMDKQAMNLIRGGVECKKKYTADSCGCGYTGPSY